MTMTMGLDFPLGFSAISSFSLRFCCFLRFNLRFNFFSFLMVFRFFFFVFFFLLFLLDRLRLGFRRLDFLRLRTR